MTNVHSPAASSAIDGVIERIDQISTLPQVAARVIAIANEAESTAADLKSAVESDPALSARVLQCVNSSAFMLRSKITNLQHAISYVGFNQVRNLAITGSVSQLFKQDIGIGSYSRMGLWQHMISVGVCARLIAMRCRMMVFEDAFLAGLLHDIGIILEDQHHHEPFCDMLASMDPERPLLESEQEFMGFDHTQLGARVAAQWQFPQTVQAAIRFHHASEDYTGDAASIVQCVEVSNFLCNLKGISATSVGQPRFPKAALQALELDREDLVVIANDLDHDLALQEGVFEL